MKVKSRLIAVLLCLGLAVPVVARAQVSDPLLKKLVDKGILSTTEAEDIQAKQSNLPAALKGLNIGGVAYFDYSFGDAGGKTKSSYNRFTLQRGYINITKEITPWLKARVTPDIKSGSTVTGDYVLRMKYLYADFLLPSLGGVVTSPDIRAGLGQTPLLDFEEALNGYRMQSAMFEDRNHLVTGSDLGISLLANIGGKLSKEQVEEVGNSHYTGRYGTFHLGIYNGGGYGASGETNQNKTLQARLTVRPLPDILPGLQFTYYGVTGKGNQNDALTGEPERLTNNTGFVSFQHKLFTVAGQYYTGKGTTGGEAGSAKKKKGYSIFAKVALPMYEKVAFFGRYDVLDPDRSVAHDKIKTEIAGVSYQIYKSNYLVFAYEKTHDETKPVDAKKGQVVLQVAF